MARGGARPGAGRKPRIINALSDEGGNAVRAATTVFHHEEGAPKTRRFNTALDALMEILNTSNDEKIILTAAQIAIPYTNAKMADATAGKKEQRQKAAEAAGGGKFAAPAPPRMVVNNK